MELTQEILDECLTIAKEKFSLLQGSIIKDYKIGKDCTSKTQMLKVLAVWEEVLDKYCLPEETTDPDCRIQEGCLSEEQIISICNKIKSLNV